MKPNKKIMIYALMMIFTVITVALISNYFIEKHQYIIQRVQFGSEIFLPEVYVKNQSIYACTPNISKWHYGPYFKTYIEKYSNHSKELIEIMKMQVVLLGEDSDLFEDCIDSSIKEIHRYINDTEVILPCFAWKGKFADSGNLLGWMRWEERIMHIYGDKEVWILMFIIDAPHYLNTIIHTYYIDIDTLTLIAPSVPTFN